MLSNIKNNSILIIPSNIKKRIIKELNKKNLNIKTISLNELIKKYTFDYNEKTIYYLMKKENIKYEIAENYIKNIYYIENKKYNNIKLDKLVEIKKYLEENNLLKYDNLFKEFIKNKSIYIYYNKISKYEKKIIDEIKKITEVNIIYPIYNNYTPEIHEFNDINQEVEFIAHNICELINNGIDINKIKIINLKDEYINEIKKTFKLYNIPIDLNKKNIYGTKLIQDFINNYKENIEETLEYIKNTYDLNNETNYKIYNKIINILNEYTWCDNYLEIKELIINKIKNTNIETKLNKKIEPVELEEITNEYAFIIGFNQGSIPKIYKDEDYIDDNTKKTLNIDTSIEKNIIEKENTIKLIKNIKNCIITYKLKTPFQTYYPSSIIEEFNTEIIKEHNFNNITYSEIKDKINLTKKLDNLIKYNIKDNELETLYENYEIPYNTYDNKYTKINKENLLEYINNKLLLSYSSMDNYYHCAFKYYINNILKLNPYEETFYTIIGSLFHYVLEKSLKNNDDYKKHWDEYISTLELTNKEKFFINNLEETCKFTVETIKKQLEYISLDKTKYEEKIYINKDTKITFMGIIDKLMYKENDEQTLVAVIDYKTGNTNIDLNKTIYGLSMQLPIYLYLAKNSGLKNVKIAGFYLQNIINKNNDENNLKLNGYSTSNKELLKQFDSSYENSNLIKSMRTKADGDFYSYSKTLNEKEIDNLINLVDNKIEEAGNNILEANFDINPKKINGINIGCEYCTFKDICFKKENDTVYLKEQDYKDFLGGENE
jgi:ATP-dependent helicase/nuclease subunit B